MLCLAVIYYWIAVFMGYLEYRLSYDYKIVNQSRNKHPPGAFEMKSDIAFTM